MALETVEVRGTYRKADDDTPLAGQIEFELTTALQDAAGNVIYEPVDVVAALDNVGHFVQDLVATDATGVEPINARYRVTHRLYDPVTGAKYRRPPYLVEILKDPPGGFTDLADLAPAVPVDPTVTYVLQSEFDTHVHGTAAENVHPGYLTSLPVGENDWENDQVFHAGLISEDPAIWIDIRAKGVTGVGLETSKVQAAVDEVIAGGAVLFSVPVTMGNVEIDGAANLTLKGTPTATITLSGTAAGGGLGFQLEGAIDGLTLDGLVIQGDGVLANKHSATWQAASNLSLKRFRARDCRISDVMCGLLVNYDNGTLSDVVIERCTIDNVVGTAAGQGYGINVSGPAIADAAVTIHNNRTSRCQRHDIYCSFGTGFTVTANKSYQHRVGVADGSIRPAFVFSRVSDVVATNNRAYHPSDGAFEVDTDGGAIARNITLDTNHAYFPQNDVPVFTVGSLNPAADGFPEEVTLRGNTGYGSTAANWIRHLSGKRVNYVSNTFASIGVTSSTSMISIDPHGEGVGTANYSDTLTVRANTLYGTAGAGGDVGGIRLSGAETTAIVMRFSSNTVNVVTSTWYVSVNVTNPWLMVTDMPLDGLTYAPGVAPFPTPTGPMKIQGVGTVYFTAAAPDAGVGVNGDWAFASDGHIYFKAAGAWAVKV